MKNLYPYLLILVAFISGLCECESPEPVIENSFLLRGAAGRLWVLKRIEDENTQYLWFDHYGNVQVLELKNDIVPNLFIPDENYPENMDSASYIRVSLNGQPYRMNQMDEGLTIRFGKVLTRTFTPDEDNYEWHRKWIAEFFPQTGEMYWILTRKFIPLENHWMTGSWESLSDSCIMLNGHSFRLVERKIRITEEEYYNYIYSEREVYMFHSETGDSIRLLDACMPHYPESGWNRTNSKHITYEKLKKKWNKNIKSSVLLQGEKYKLYVIEHKIPSGGTLCAYYDDQGIFACCFIAGDGSFTNLNDDILFSTSFWYQKGNTLYEGIEDITKSHIKEVSPSGDTIKFWGENQQEFLYIDRHLPSIRKKK